MSPLPGMVERERSSESKMLTDTVWKDTVWKDVWKPVWASAPIPIPFKDGVYFMIPMGGGVIYLKKL